MLQRTNLTDLQRSLRSFRLQVMLRVFSYAALCGLLLALVLVVAAPWIQNFLGEYAYWITLAVPIAFPVAWMLAAWFSIPDERTVVMAADAWCGGKGEIVSAWELERANPDSPFAKPVAENAIRSLRRRRLPEPRLLRKLLAALVVLLALVPLSRVVHAAVQDDKEEEKQREQAAKTDVDPKLAAMLARDAGDAAEKAKDLGADQQEQLADDIEQLARNAQAGGQDKERALREANSLVDRAKSQRETQEARGNAREKLSESPATRRLAQAIENADPEETRRAIEAITEELRNSDGTIDPDAAAKLREAVEKAAAEAPHDPALRRAAEKLGGMLDEKAERERAARDKRARENMTEQGLSEAEIDAAIAAMRMVDAEALRKALEEFSKTASPMRDIDSRQAEELLRKLESGEITPEQARQLAEAARELAGRMEIDAETLREMLKKGKDFEGLEDAARRAMERAAEEGRQPGEQGIPEWAKDAVPEELLKQWQEARKAESGTPSGDGKESGQKGRKGDQSGSDGGGHAKGNGGKSPEIDGGKDVGVETTDTGKGEKDPDSEENELDPEKAKAEAARREASGRDASSKGVNTRDDNENLPRRYRDAARKYFER